ncbi:MAG: hypothetical protein K0Q49_1496 [Haloplasmataceae bacterium]|jgi:MtN3 and saliva related transmembrane protein|nr:hypothetical protein [Haloplasmataceae bacterium]
MEGIVIEIIGYFAAVITTLSFLPQALKIIHTKDTTSISLGMYALMSTGMFLWFIYGIYQKALPIILANGISLVFTMIILIMKIRHR